MKDYTLYAFFPKTAIYALRTKVVIGTMGVYILCWMTFMLVRGYVAESNMRQMEKQYHIIQSVSSVFSICMLLDLKKNTWEMIKASDQIRKMTGNETNTANMMKFFCKNTVAQSERQKFWDFVNPDTLAERLQGKDYINCQTEIGKGEWFSIMLVPQHHDAHGNVEAALFLSRNITDEKMREMDYQKKLEKSVEQAEQANIAKTDFLRRMSHDIRTPMNAIIGYAELADRNLDKKELLRSYLEKIGICGQKMLSILDNVLELSRIETGNVVLEESAAEAESVLDDCLHMVSAEIEKKHQTLTVSKNIIYPYIYMDISRFTEIILNLISNAIKYTGEGGTIHCSVRQLPAQKDGRCIQELSVSDNGIGMSEEFQKHIFESFTRERSSTVSGVEGTGLGMGIVKKLVEMMHGEIKIHSRMGEGSTFTIRIPCRIATFEDTQTKRAQVHPDGKPLVGKRILLAEDNDLNAEIAIALLEEEGLLVERAADGVKCMEMLEKAPAHFYELILMDIQMPILGGYDTTREIRKMADAEKAAIPIIAMTANAFAEDKQRALEAGMNDHVAKPIDMNKLIPTLQKYI